MANRVILSKRGRVSLVEWLKSAAYAVGTSVMFEVQKYFDKGDFNINWKQLGMIAAGAFVAFLLGRIAAKPSVKTTYDSNEKAEQIAEEINS